MPADEGTESLLVGTVTDTDEGIGVLRGWKDIAKYLRTSERTATRWSIEKGLPVHRSGRGSLVVAYRSELDGWQREMAGTVGSLTDAPESPRPGTGAQLTSAGRTRHLTAALIFLLLLVAILGLARSNGLLGLKNPAVTLGDRKHSTEGQRFLVRLEPEGLEPASVMLGDGGTASVDFPGHPTIRLKVRKNGSGVVVTVAQQGTSDGVGKGASDTTLEMEEEGARVRLKKPFPLVLTWQKQNGRPPAD